MSSLTGGPLERQGEALGIPGATRTRTSPDLPAQLAYEDWEQVGWAVGRIPDMTAWALGDGLNYGEAVYGEKYAQAVEATGRSKSTLLEHARVARQIPPTRRRPGLSFTHHHVVAAKTLAEQAEWLDKAEANAWTVEELRGVLRPIALSTRQRRSRCDVEVLELVQDIARVVLERAQPLGDGFVRTPEDLLERLANALGEPR